MPTYVFECPGCQHRFELTQSINDNHQADCPLCGQPALLIPSWSGELMMEGRVAVKSSWRGTWI